MATLSEKDSWLVERYSRTIIHVNASVTVLNKASLSYDIEVQNEAFCIRYRLRFIFIFVYENNKLVTRRIVTNLLFYFNIILY